MLRNYIQVAFRYFIRYRGYSLLNVVGLSIGLTSAMLILLWVHDELTFDTHFPDRERIFRIMENQTYSDGETYTFAATPGPLAEALITEIPEIQLACRTTWFDRLLLSNNTDSYYELGFYADSTIFSLFGFPMLQGDPDSPLPDDKSISISKKMATKYFGKEACVGKVLRIGKDFDVTITSVFADHPENSQFKFDFILPFSVYLKNNSWLDNWGSNAIQTYVKLTDARYERKVNQMLKGFINKHDNNAIAEPFLFPVKDWRLRGAFREGHQVGGRIVYVQTFFFIALFLIIIACINFMNMATARASLRTKEVGIRKTVGAQKWNLVLQFMSEAFLNVAAALILSILSTQLLIPFFNTLTGKEIVLDFGNPYGWIIIAAIFFFTGLLSGSYPAFFLSSFKPVLVLKGNSLRTQRGAFIRKHLVVFQFVLSIILISGATIIFNQIEYVRTKNLGFDRANIITFSKTQELVSNTRAFMNDMLQSPHVRAIAMADQNPMNIGSSNGGAKWPGMTPGEDILFQVINCDHNFIPAMGFEIIQGRNFSPDRPADSVAFLISQESANRMGLTNPIGLTLDFYGQKGEIIGVVKDFHSWSFQHGLQPVVFVLGDKPWQRFYLKYEPEKTTEVIDLLTDTYKKYEQVFPLEYKFLDDEFEAMYRSEMTLGKLALYFTCVAILISSIGLFGLASFVMERRTKEIGIRKVMGASVGSIIQLVGMEFIKLVLMAVGIGCPIAYYIMKGYLNQYAFHVELRIADFITAALLLMTISITTVLYQVITASTTNPVSSLRNE